MSPLRTSSSVFALSISLLVSCGGDDGMAPDPDGGPNLDPNATFAVSGVVLDLATGEPIDGSATVTVEGVAGNPAVSITGAEYSVEVPANSTFHLLAGSPPDYRSTYNAAVEVTNDDLSGVDLYAVSEAYLAQLASDFTVAPTFGKGIVIVLVVDDGGAPVAGVPADAFEVPDGALGPYFLDAGLGADAEATSTSASGLVVFFDVEPGVASLASDPEADYALSAPDAPVAGTAVSYFSAVATTGDAIILPTNVSFSNDVAPIFTSRGCVACHDGGGVGKDLGGVHFNGSAEKMYKELVEEVSANYGVVRVDVENPELSMVLNLPRCQALVCPREPEAELAHPFATFTGADDPDYQLIYSWISEGALNN